MNYWPEEAGNAPYATGLAEHLVSRGARVSVIAGMPYYPSWRIAPGYGKRFRYREAHHGVSIHRFRQYIPAKQTAARRIWFEVSFLLNALVQRRVKQPDLVIGVLPSLSSGVLAGLAAKRYGAPLVLIVQDLVGQAAVQSGIQGGSRVATITSKIEAWVARQARSIGIVAEGFRHRLEEMGVAPDRLHRIRNWTHIQAVTATSSETRAALNLPTDARICLHAGNMGLKQGLENVIACARLAQGSSPELLFVLMGDGNQRAMLVELAAGLPNVRFLDPQDDAMFPNVLASADVLLVNQRPSVTDMSLPSKLTSYFAAGRPVVAAVAPESEAAREIAVSGGGIVTAPGQPRELLTAILSITDDPVRANALGHQGQVYAREALAAENALARIITVIALAAGNAPIRAQEALMS